MPKPGIPQGTRDFSADVVRKRQYIVSTIRDVFERYGFQPLETPAFENLDTLMGKYGDEGDKLIFKILNNGLDHPDKKEIIQQDFEKVLQGRYSRTITERALKYDLTIPFARYVAMNHGQLVMPFKRYQIQPVWRADRPQKGRYREFWQCDADVVGSTSLLNEVDLVHIYRNVFRQLGIPTSELRINSRKVLAALAELSGGAGKMMDITVAIDKLDKIGLDSVKEELSSKGLGEEAIAVIERYLQVGGSNEEKMKAVGELLGRSEMGRKGLEELQFVLSWINEGTTADSPPLIIDFTLARGLNYYTGIIFEAKAPAEVKIGSIGGGGRYDDLTGMFGVPHVPGVGISFGLDRIYDVLEEMNLFPASVTEGTKVLFFNLGEQECKVAYRLLHQVRESGTPAEIYHEVAKMDKQFRYAEKKHIPAVVIIGSKEVDAQVATVKKLHTSEQSQIPFKDLAKHLSE